MNYYHNTGYAAGRLEGTVVQTTEGVPVLVYEITGSGYAVKILETGKHVLLKPSEVDLTPVKLGWVNDEANKNSYFLSRVPVRAWKQGLSAENLATNYKIGHCPVKFVSESFHNVVMGIYPPISQAFDMLADGWGVVGVRRQWAFSATTILYKGRVVGTHTHSSFYLNENEAFLKESFERQTGRYCEN